VGKGKSNEAGTAGIQNKLECSRSHTSWISTCRVYMRFGWLGLDGVSESAENMDRDFSDMNMKEQVLGRYLYTY
jgi:hypothetical protein